MSTSGPLDGGVGSSEWPGVQTSPPTSLSEDQLARSQNGNGIPRQPEVALATGRVEEPLKEKDLRPPAPRNNGGSWNSLDIQTVSSIPHNRETPDEYEKRVRRYYVITWVGFFTTLILLLGIEMGVLVGTGTKGWIHIFGRFAPEMQTILRSFNELSNGGKNATETAANLRIIWVSVQSIARDYNQAEETEIFFFRATIIANSVAGAILLGVALICVIYRKHPMVKSRGSYFLGQYFISGVLSLVFSVLVCGYYIFQLGPFTFDPRKFSKYTPDDIVSMSDTINLAVLFLNPLLYLSMSSMFSAIVQRQRLLSLIFLRKETEMRSFYEYFKLYPIVLVMVPVSVGLTYYSNVSNVAVGDNIHIGIEAVHPLYVMFWVFSVVYLTLVVYYSRGVRNIDLQFCDAYCNARVIVSLTIYLVVLASSVHAHPELRLNVFSLTSLVRVAVTLYCVDSLIVCYTYNRIFLKEEGKGENVQVFGLGNGPLSTQSAGNVRFMRKWLREEGGL